MYRDQRISLCLPCRNEAKHLREIIKTVPDFVDEIIIISNKSTDNTLKVAKQLNLIAVEDNRTIDGIGYGFAHMSGIEKATGDIIIGADGDGTYPIGDSASVIDYLLDNKLNFVSCNRYPLHVGTEIPFKLRLGVWALNLEVRLLYGTRVKDILSGMWVFKKSIAKDLKLTMGDWNLSPQIKINAIVSPKIKFGEFGIVQRQRMGESHQAHFKTGFSHLWWIFRNRLTSGRSLKKA